MDREDSSRCSKQRGLEVLLRPGWKGEPWLSRGRRVKTHGVWNNGGVNGLCVDSPPVGNPDELQVLYESDMQYLNITGVLAKGSRTTSLDHRTFQDQTVLFLFICFVLL